MALSPDAIALLLNEGCFYYPLVYSPLCLDNRLVRSLLYGHGELMAANFNLGTLRTGRGYCGDRRRGVTERSREIGCSGFPMNLKIIQPAESGESGDY